MKIINAVPHSYLVIKGSGDQEILKQLFITIAEQEGVDKNRLRFLPQTLTEENSSSKSEDCRCNVRYLSL